MLTRSELKSKAKESLEGKYGDSIGIILLQEAIPAICGIIVAIICSILKINETGTSFILSIVSAIITSMLAFGSISFFLKISRGENVEINELWSFKDKWYIYIAITIMISLFTWLWSLLFIIPGIIAIFSYSMALNCYLDNPNLDIMGSIKESKRIMKGHKMDLFILNLSFLGWIILGIFTFGLLYFWLIPYMAVTNMNFYNNIKELS